MGKIGHIKRTGQDTGQGLHVRVYGCLCSYTAIHGTVAAPELHQGNNNSATAATLDELRKLNKLRKKVWWICLGKMSLDFTTRSSPL